MNCDNCGVDHPRRGRFCGDKCRGEWHRTYDPHGVVKSVRRLANGGTAVITHFAGNDAERALRFELKQSIVLGAVAPDTERVPSTQPE